MKVSAKTKTQLADSPRYGEKAQAIIGSYRDRLTEGERRIKALADYLEAGGYGRPTDKVLHKLARDLGLVVQRFGKYPGFLAPLREGAPLADLSTDEARLVDAFVQQLRAAKLTAK